MVAIAVFIVFSFIKASLPRDKVRPNWQRFLPLLKYRHKIAHVHGYKQKKIRALARSDLKTLAIAVFYTSIDALESSDSLRKDWSAFASRTVMVMLV